MSNVRSGLCGVLGILLAAACTNDIVLPSGLAPDDARRTELPVGSGGDDGRDDAGRAFDARFSPARAEAAAGNGPRDGGRADAPRDATTTACMLGSDIATSKSTATTVIALDRSQSMFFASAFGRSGSRIQAAQNALRDLVRRYPKSIKFSYTEFPAHRCQGPICCVSAPTTPVYGAAPVIEDRMRCESPMSGCFDLSQESPSHTALAVVDQLFGPLFKPPGYVLMLTDGDPSCGAQRNTDVCQIAEEHVIKLRDRGVETFVVGISEEVKTSTCLGRLALYGGGEDKPVAPYYRLAADEQQLRQHLFELGHRIASNACRVTLQSTPVNRDALVVMVDGSQVSRDSTDGWDYVAGSSLRLTLHGKACEALILSQSRADTLDVFNCR